jgi:spermidine synthase
MSPSFYGCRPVLHFLLAGCVLAASFGASSRMAAAVETPQVNLAGELEFEGRSDYSHVLIRRRGTVRSMVFVRDSGEEVLESQVDLRKPYELQFEYLRFMFTSYLLREPQEDVLIVGLGGGGMIHFLKRLDPKIRIDAVEIDPLVVRLAAKYFDTRSGGTVRIETADGLKFIAAAEKKYDAIYMDAFLKPSQTTDSTGAPLTLRTQQFYRKMQEKLKPGGIVAFNINPHQQINDDIRTIAASFPQTYVFPLSQFGGAVVIGSTEKTRLDPRDLVARGRDLDRRYKSPVRFQEMARRVQPQR